MPLLPGTRLDRTIAIKVLLGAVASDPDQHQRFDREARAISSLDHPHICALYDVGHQNGIDFLVMQYLEGETLASRSGKAMHAYFKDDALWSIVAKGTIAVGN